MIAILFRKWKARRKAEKLKRAAKLIRDAGFVICELKTVAGTTYIKHNEGNCMRIGRLI